jgi:hypothetical protein
MPKNTNMDMGGIQFQLTASEIKALGKMIDEVKKLNNVYKQNLEIRKKITELEVKTAFANKEDTKHYKTKKEAMNKISDYLWEARKDWFDRLKTEAIPRTSGPKFERKSSTQAQWARATGGTADQQWEWATGAQRVKNDEKELTLMGRLKKSYAWQLLYFMTVALLFKGLLANSKVWAHFLDVIGGALGFITDMILVSVIPQVVWLVNKLFEIGGWFAGLPTPVKQAIVLIGLFIGAFLFAEVLLTLGEVVTAIKAIGTASTIANAEVAGAGGLLAGLKAVGALGTIAILFKYGVIGAAIAAGVGFLAPSATGLEQRYRNGMLETRIGRYGQGPEEGWAPGQIPEIAQEEYNRGIGVGNTTVNVFIAGKAVDKAFIDFNTQQQMKYGIPRSL